MSAPGTSGRTVSELRVVIAGQESAGAQALEHAIARGHRVLAVLTDPRREPSGVSSIEAAATRHGIEVLDPGRVRDPELASWLRSESVDLLLNVHSLYVVHDAVVRAPAIGSFNLHPGPLPEYPGLNAPSWAVSERETTFGCTVHRMDAGIDTGPVAYRATFPVKERETGLTLTARCVRAGLPLLRRLLDDASTGGSGAVPRLEQRGQRVERGPGPPHGGRVPWSLEADRIEAFVRACDYGPFPSPWGRPRTSLDGRDAAVLRAAPERGHRASAGTPAGEVVDVDGGDLLVAAGAGSILRVSRMQVEGRPVRAADVAGRGARFLP